MSFYNLTVGETRAICDFTERRATRTRMTFIGGHSGPVKREKEEAAESATPFLDCVVGVVEAVQRRYALTCTSTDANAPDVSAGRTEEREGECEVESRAGERPYPFPSLFLHTPRQLVELQNAISSPSPTQQQQQQQQESNSDSNLTTTSSLSNVHCTPQLPPTSLLFTHADAAANAKLAESSSRSADSLVVSTSSMVAAPLPYDAADAFPEQLRRHAAPVQMNPSLKTARRMVNVSLTPSTTENNNVDADNNADAVSPPMQQMLQVVLQAEAALVVAGPPPSVAGTADTKKKKDEAMAPFLLSPDATSCVLVACRITLHPALQRAMDAVEASDTTRAALADEAQLRLQLLHAALHTATACMAHLDRPDGVQSVLREMVWESAVPAFFHAVHQHACGCLPTQPSPAAAVSMLEDAVQAVWRLSSSLHSGEESGLPLPSLLHVDWYVVGGIRMKACAAPVLAAVFRAFFPPTATTATTTNSALPQLLREEVALDAVLADAISSSSSSPPSEKRGKTVVRVAHRLREDGQCFWSFNTTFQPWCVDPKAAQRYAYPITWGLLLSVATGASWPATVQPGTRLIPLAELRTISTSDGYRWVSPLEAKDSAADNLTVVCNAVPSSTVAQRVNKLAMTLPPALRLWSAFSAVDTTTTSTAAALPTAQLSLASYVHTMLLRQHAWWLRWWSPVAPSPSPDAPRRVLPLFLSRYRRLEGDAAAAAEGMKVPIHWECVSVDLVRRVLAQPLVSLLNGSTTPHCEPPDFCEMSRNQLLWRTLASDADVFVEGTDGLYVD